MRAGWRKDEVAETASGKVTVQKHIEAKRAITSIRFKFLYAYVLCSKLL